MEQVNHFADRVIQENPSVVIRPPILAGQLCPAQDKGVQNLCLVGQGLECRGFKEEIGEPGEAERLFRLMNVIVFVIARFVDGRSPFSGAGDTLYHLPRFGACKA